MWYTTAMKPFLSIKSDSGLNLGYYLLHETSRQLWLFNKSAWGAYDKSSPSQYAGKLTDTVGLGEYAETAIPSGLTSALSIGDTILVRIFSYDKAPTHDDLSGQSIGDATLIWTGNCFSDNVLTPQNNALLTEFYNQSKVASFSSIVQAVNRVILDKDIQGKTLVKTHVSSTLEQRALLQEYYELLGWDVEFIRWAYAPPSVYYVRLAK